MSSLSDTEIDAIIRTFGLSTTKEAFIGVFPIDKLPSRIPHYPCFLVVNTQAHNLPGEHWLSIYISKQRKGEVFDSLGQPIGNFLRRWLTSHAINGWTSNRRIYQNPLSDTCGAFAIFYVLNRLQTDKLPFSNCFFNNEVIVKSFYNTLLGRNM